MTALSGGIEVEDIRQQLQKQSKKWLVDRLVELSMLDSANADQLVLSLVAEDADEQTIVATFRRQVDKAAAEIESHGGNSEVLTAAFDSAADALTIVLSKDLPNAVIKISEYALVKLDSVFELQDECELEHLLNAFRHLHLEACYRLKPEPRTLGARLAELSAQTEWGFFDGPPDGYVELIGQAGLSAFLAMSRANGNRC